MTDRDNRRQPRSGRARKRAIRTQASLAGVPYSVAARQLTAGAQHRGEISASRGRTVYPAGDAHRQWWVETRSRRALGERIKDARLAAVVPSGRAAHLAEWFPPTRGVPGCGVGLLYHGEGRVDALAMTYLAVAEESPGLVPAVGELAWIAEMGEESAVDMACAGLDRAARHLLDLKYAALRVSIEAALRVGAAADDWRIRSEAARLTRMYDLMLGPYAGRDGELYVGCPPFVGIRQILDALLVVAEDGHAPGTRVRMLRRPYAGRLATIVGIHWGPAGAPMGYRVRPDGARATADTAPTDLVVLPNQETLPGASADEAGLITAGG